MKTLQTILGIFFCSTIFSQTTTNDTIFLKREWTKDSYNIVYVDSNRSLKQYDWLIPTLDNNEKTKELYNNQIKSLLKDTSVTYTKIDFKNIPRKWTEIHIYKDKYYVYWPSDWLNNFEYILTDSTLINIPGEGPYPEIIIEYNKKSEINYNIKALSFNNSISKYEIFIIDKRNEIAIWKSKSNGTISYRLMINSMNIRRFPMVICVCSIGKCFNEFEFDKFDYEKLINNAR